MEELSRRPLGTFASVFYISACVLCHCGVGASSAAAPLFLFMFAAVLIFGSGLRYRRLITAVCAALLTAALFTGFAVDVRLARTERLAGTSADIVGCVTDVRYSSSWEGCYTVDADGMKILLYSDDSELRCGDVVSCTVVYERLDGVGDYREYMISGGILLSAETVGELRVIGRSRGLGVMCRELRNALSSRLRSAMSEESGGFAAALILGDRSHLSDSISRDFRTLGISHILSLSGTHLGVLCLIVMKIIPGRRKKLRFFAVCPVILFYMLITGLSPSVTRAGGMYLIASAATLVNKRSDSFTSLSAAVFLICLLSPYAPFDVGLQLSYLSVVGLIVASHVVKRVSGDRQGIAAVLLKAAVPAVIVPVAVLPLMWLRFGEVSLVSPAANILFAPVTSFLILLFALLVISSGLALLFMPFSRIADAAASVFLWAVKRAANTADALLPLTGKVTSVLIVLFTLALFSAVLLGGKARHVSVSASALFLILSLVSAQIYVNGYNRGMTVCYAASGTDEAVCAVSEGCSILIDIGDHPSALMSAALLGEEYGAGRIDALYLTELHRSHTSVICKIAENFYLESLWLPAAVDSGAAELSQKLREDAESLGVRVYTYVPCETLCFGGCELSAPVIGSGESSVSRAVSFSLKCGGDVLSYSSGGEFFDKGISIIGVHGSGSWDVPDTVSDEDRMIVSEAGAKMLEAVPCGALISDGAVIRFAGNGRQSCAVYPREATR